MVFGIITWYLDHSKFWSKNVRKKHTIRFVIQKPWHDNMIIPIASKWFIRINTYPLVNFHNYFLKKPSSIQMGKSTTYLNGYSNNKTDQSDDISPAGFGFESSDQKLAMTLASVAGGSPQISPDVESTDFGATTNSNKLMRFVMGIEINRDFSGWFIDWILCHSVIFFSEQVLPKCERRNVNRQQKFQVWGWARDT